MCIEVGGRSIALAVVLSLGASERAAAADPWGRLEAGRFEVGVRSTLLSSGAEASPTGNVEVTHWYPTAASEGGRLEFGDYVRRGHSQESATRESLGEWLAIGLAGDGEAVSEEVVEEILSASMRARPDALPSAGSFPLVLWTMRHDTLVAQSVLSEYLASHGYVVAAVRPVGARMPRPWELQSEEEKLSTFASHLADLQLALDRLRDKPNVDGSRVAVLTWSYAAELAPQLQRANPSVRVVVGLSSNPLSSAGLYQGERAASFLEPEKLTAHYVVMTESIGPNGQKRVAPPILDELPAESYFVSFAELAHGNFNTLEGMLPGVWGLETVQPWSKGGETAQLGYETISRSVRAFLDYFLASDPRDSGDRPATFDRSWVSGLPDGFVTLSRYPRSSALE